MLLAALETESVGACCVCILLRAQRRVLGGSGFWPCLPGAGAGPGAFVVAFVVAEVVVMVVGIAVVAAIGR